MFETKQGVCDAMCKAIQSTDAGGSPINNPLKEIRYIVRDDGTEIARPIFENGAGKNGWYDVNITGDSGIAIIMDVVKHFVRSVW